MVQPAILNIYRNLVGSPRIPSLLYLLQAGDASGTGLMDVAQRCWDARLAAMIDDKLAGCLQRIIGPDEVSVCIVSIFVTQCT